MIKDISLFEHNEKAYEALASSLEKNPLAFIEHATGTGKSFILLKYLYTAMRNKRILFVTRHYEMLEQLFNEQMESLGLSKDDFVKFDTAIYPNLLEMDMNEVIKDYDCIVWDEAHHCGAPKWGAKVNELKELVKKTPGKKMIGATATRIRYLDDYMDVAENYFDGNVVSELPVTRAILKNLLPAPSIIMTGQSCLEQVEKVQKKLNKIPRTKEVESYQKYIENLKEYLIDEYYVGNVLKKYDVKPGEKYIVFCSDINDVKRKMQDAEQWFKDIGPVKMYSAHSGQKRSTNIEQIKSFSEKREETSLIFAVDIFNEGFHIDGVDGILTFRKTKSPIVYWQQLGRALSFSARKKQIKIFDFANNTSDNKVVYELYREMLEEAKRLISIDPENKELYAEILSRFQIVDQTTAILEKLHEIESKIDQEFIIKNRIDLAIYKLEEYRNFYPNTNFNDELVNGKLLEEYINAYNYLCDVEDYLTLEQIERLQNLNIVFTAKINLPKNKRLEILGESKTFKELEEKQLDDFINSYIEFCTKNNKRPTTEDNRELYLLYRNYLNKLSKSKINRLLSKIPFRLTLEETILLGNYPSRDDINSYIEKIKLKISQNIPLDQVEIKVLRKISHAIPQSETKLLEYLNNHSDINYKINEAIETIRKYKNGENLLNTKNYKKALRTINRFALRITNEQFAQLLELGIKLPKKIDMTMERRLEELKEFDSFYAKNQSKKNSAINAYIQFLYENKRRPNLSDDKESNLQHEYEVQIFKTSGKKIKEITTLLLELNIPLTREEAVLSKRVVPIEELDSFIISIRTKLLDNQDVSNEELKMLRCIEQNNYPVQFDISSFIKMITYINMINEMIKNYQSDKLNVFQKENLMHSIFIKNQFLTRSHIAKLNALNINVPQEIVEFLDKTPDCINRFESEFTNQEKFWSKFLAFLKNAGNYPDKDSDLMREYRQYLSSISKGTLKQKLAQIKLLGIPLGIEERLLSNDYEANEAIAYFEAIKNKINNSEELDDLEARVCQSLDKFNYIQEYSEIAKPKEKPVSTLESRIISNLFATINQNPFAQIDLDTNFSLSRHNKKRIESYKRNMMGRKVFSDILNAMKKEKKSLDEVLDESIKQTFTELTNSHDLDGENVFLLNQIRKYNNDYLLRQQEISIDEFVAEYISFIQNTNGARPNISSEDEAERILATKYEKLKDLLEEYDFQCIEKAIKDTINEDEAQNFYPRLIEFIQEFGRFPCGNSDNTYEVHLNTLFQNMGSSLTKEQNNEIKKLKKKYGQATILANIQFSKNSSVKK